MDRRNEHFDTGRSDHDRALTWDDITTEVINYRGSEDIDWAAHTLSHGTDDDPDAERGPGYVDYHAQVVPVSKIRSVPIETSDYRVQSALKGYHDKVNMPPPVLVERSGGYEVADGHHRIAALRHLGTEHVAAYVTVSPHKTSYPEIRY